MASAENLPAARPLQTKKIILSPSSSPVGRARAKRAASTTTDPSSKRARVLFSPTFLHSSSEAASHLAATGSRDTITTTTILRAEMSRATTPTPGDSFKVPALPVRIMTPSTSTVAHSSSPRRDILSSSPIREVSVTTTTSSVRLVPGLTLIFGRHRHRPTHISSCQSTILSSSVPSHLIHLLAQPATPAEIVHLPRTASHASRVHATVEYLSDLDVLRLVVIGQNGVRVRSELTARAQRLKSGQRLDLSRPLQGDVEIDFYGCKTSISFPTLPTGRDLRETEKEGGRERLFSPSSSPISSPPSPATSMPLSSPPMLPAELDIDMDADSDALSSPLLSAEPGFVEDEEEEAEELGASSLSMLDERSIKEELLESAFARNRVDVVEAAAEHGALDATVDGVARKSRPVSRAATPQPVVERALLPKGVDLPAILASTVVFSGSSKLSLPDLVKHMLESQPSLREHGDEQRWASWAKHEVEGNAMFGKVERHGKDASGHPLLPHYFYNPAHDPDTSRAKELGGLVRPLRAAQRAGGKAIDWRPVGGGRRRY